ncbi:MAG: AAA family ATPase [Bacteroides sp.]|nr:AAA family ATPase [Bacteroides sp.]
MKSISFKNFRRFADFPEFKFGDITILVGGNNAGKSTLLKALILLVDNMKEMKTQKDDIFDWDKYVFSYDMDHIHKLNLGTFGRALRIGAHDNNEEQMEFTAMIGNFRITFDAGNSSHNLSAPNSPVNIIIEDLKRGVVFTNDWAGGMSVEFLNDQQAIEASSDIEDEIASLKLKIGQTEDLAEIVNLSEQLEKLEKVREAQSDILSISSPGRASITASNYINLIAEKDFSIPTNPIARIIYQWVAYLTTRIGLAEFKFVPLDDDDPGRKEIGNMPVADFLAQHTGEDPYYDLYEETQADDLAREAHVANYALLDGKETLLRDIAHELDATLNRLNDFDEVYYIQAHAITQRVLYSIDNRNDYMAQVLHKFSRENILKGTEADRFLCKWLYEFGIGGDYRLQSIEGEGYTLEIETANGVWQHLADLGMGSNQLVTLLMELATLLKVKGNRQYPLIIVEEPEQNLHPKVQSKLADLFSELNKNRGFKFLIETHSEYLIRRTQVLVAEMNIENEEEFEKQNPFKVYYFPENGTPYDMKYRVDGCFSNEFGSGFFDEASNLAFKLF